MDSGSPAETPEAAPLLAVDGLCTWFHLRSGKLLAIDQVSFTVDRGECVALVGESGCGKSVTALSIMRLLPSPPTGITARALRFAGTELLQLPEEAMRRRRGRDMAMIFQEPMTSLHPILKVGRQVTETLEPRPRAGKRARALELMRRVRIPDPERRLSEYPHQLSGGMRQRVMIATALAGNPKLLIADEPTTALDVTIQAQILDLLSELRRELGMALLLITHDMGVVAENADRVLVMYAGRVVEEARVTALFERPLHPYTAGLMASIPRLDAGAPAGQERLREIPGIVPSLRERPAGCAFAPRCGYATARCRSESPPLLERLPGHLSACWEWERLGAGAAIASRPRSGRIARKPAAEVSPLIEVSDLKKHFPIRKGFLRRVEGYVYAVDGISFTIGHGETLGLVGESGCGKSTAARVMLRLMPPTAGSIRLAGEDITHVAQEPLRRLRRRMQIIFQDPYSSLDPRESAGAIVAEPMVVHRTARGQALRDRVAELFRKVGLRPDDMRKHPAAFSGGQRQRIGIARALALDPSLIVCDEPVSALDVSIQAQVINLLMDLQDELGLSYLFIAHDLAVVRHISHRVAVMYLGRIVEYAGKEALFREPLHPYTQALLAAIPLPDPRSGRAGRVTLADDLPSPANPPPGCRFHTRCPLVFDRCRQAEPPLQEVKPGHFAACFLYDGQRDGT